MKLKFTKALTVEGDVDELGGKLECELFSLTVPPAAVVGKRMRIGFTLYEYRPEESESVDEDHVTDLVVLHPCGKHFAKEVTISFNMKHVLRPQNHDACLLYEERDSGAFIASPVRAFKSAKVYGEMTAVLHEFSLDVTTNHFCKFFSCLFRCVGHCYRALAFGRWAKGEAQMTAAIDLLFTSSRPSHVDFVKEERRSMPVLLNSNATIYFPRRGRFTLEVTDVSDGWELVSRTTMSIEKQELKQARSHASKTCTRSFLLKKTKEDAGELWLEVLLTDDFKTECILLLKEYSALQARISFLHNYQVDHLSYVLVA